MSIGSSDTQLSAGLLSSVSVRLRRRLLNRNGQSLVATRRSYSRNDSRSRKQSPFYCTRLYSNWPRPTCSYCHSSTRIVYKNCFVDGYKVAEGLRRGCGHSVRHPSENRGEVARENCNGARRYRGVLEPDVKIEVRTGQLRSKLALVSYENSAANAGRSMFGIVRDYLFRFASRRCRFEVKANGLFLLTYDNRCIEFPGE